VPRIPGRELAQSAVPERIVLTGDVPNIAHRPEGCLFHPRCYWKQPDCDRTSPELRVLEGDDFPARTCACHFADDPAVTTPN
jgi:oligopeptide/dipeptide ABC transporter ATP-binding protein